MRVYSVKDQKAQFFMNPFIQRNKGEALRGFTQASKDPNSMINKAPKDFDLYELGEWDDLSGCIKTHSVPVHVINANELEIEQ